MRAISVFFGLFTVACCLSANRNRRSEAESPLQKVVDVAFQTTLGDVLTAEDAKAIKEETHSLFEISDRLAKYGNNSVEFSNKLREYCDVLFKSTVGDEVYAEINAMPGRATDKSLSELYDAVNKAEDPVLRQKAKFQFTMCAAVDHFIKQKNTSEEITRGETFLMIESDVNAVYSALLTREQQNEVAKLADSRMDMYKKMAAFAKDSADVEGQKKAALTAKKTCLKINEGLPKEQIEVLDEYKRVPNWSIQELYNKYVDMIDKIEDPTWREMSRRLVPLCRLTIDFMTCHYGTPKVCLQ